MTKQLEGRGIGRGGKLGLEAYPRRQREVIEAELQARRETSLEAARLRDLAQAREDSLKDAKRALRDAMGREREALALGDMDAAKAARSDVRAYRKASRFK
ncbi:hypothetical protein [Streptomyces sp. NPDC055080]